MKKKKKKNIYFIKILFVPNYGRIRYIIITMVKFGIPVLKFILWYQNQCIGKNN